MSDTRKCPTCKGSGEIPDVPVIFQPPADVVAGGILRKPEQWQQILGVRIIDPDGWRGRNGAPWDRPITEATFLERMTDSTVDTRIDTTTHNPWDIACAKHLHGEPYHRHAHCYQCRPPA